MTHVDEAAFFETIRRLAGKVPFAVDAVAMNYAMCDEDTPVVAKVEIAAALAYLVMPLDLIPDFLIPFPVGFSDDAAALATCLALVAVHVTEKHYRLARAWFAG
jgi:uncharacterized membrane protein YkvA (DUF1232 family)